MNFWAKARGDDTPCLQVGSAHCEWVKEGEEGVIPASHSRIRCDKCNQCYSNPKCLLHSKVNKDVWTTRLCRDGRQDESKDLGLEDGAGCD